MDSMYNIIFTAYPIGWFATYDKERNYDELENNPKYYKKGLQNGYFNVYIFWQWYFYGLVAGILIFWHISFVYMHNNLENLDVLGHSFLFCIIFFANFKLLIKTKSHNFLSVFLFMASNFSYVLVIYLSDNYTGMMTFQFFSHTFKDLTFYLLVILIISACMMGEYAWESSLILLHSLFQIIKKALVDMRIKKEKNKMKSILKKDFEENRKKEKENKRKLELDMSRDYKIDFFNNSINHINPLVVKPFAENEIDELPEIPNKTNEEISQRGLSELKSREKELTKQGAKSDDQHILGFKRFCIFYF